MKSTTFKTIKWFALSSFALVMTLVFQSCTDSTAPQLSDEFSEADIQAATEIMGSALADETDGVVSTMYDATATVSSEGIFFGRNRAKNNTQATLTNGPNGSDHGYGPYNPNCGRNNEREFEYSYDPETGIHFIHFKRVIDNNRLQKTMEADMKYIFRNVDGNFIEHPRLYADSIESTDYNGVRTGTHESNRRYAEYLRKDTLYLNGQSEASDILNISGNHYGKGMMELTRPDSTINRRYDLTITLNNIQVDKAVVESNGSLEEGVTGTMDYDLTIWRSNGIDETERTISGTIELDGDGTALLRFKRLTRFFNIDLLDGMVEEAPGSPGYQGSGNNNGHNGNNGNNGNGGNGGNGNNGGNGGNS